MQPSDTGTQDTEGGMKELCQCEPHARATEEESQMQPLVTGTQDTEGGMSVLTTCTAMNDGKTPAI
jgi:hypothetical protein